MCEKSKLQTIHYIFLLTVLPQLIVIAAVVSVGCWAFWMNRYGGILISLLGIVGFIAMLFTFVCVSVLVHSYGLSLFAKTRKEFHPENYKAPPITRIDYSVGRKSTLTGTRPIYVRTRQVASGGPILVMGGQAILVGLTGIFKFAIEAVRVYMSDNRQAEWEGCREYMKEKMSEETKISFFKVPILCGICLVSVWILMAPTVIYQSVAYSPRRLEFNMTEKYNTEYSEDRISILFQGELTNKGHKKVKHVKGVLYFKDRRGDILFEGDITFDAAFSTSASMGDCLEKDESWDLSLKVYSTPQDTGMQKMWDCDFDDIEISMAVEEIRYEEAWYIGEKFMDFNKPKTIIVKAFGD